MHHSQILLLTNAETRRKELYSFGYGSVTHTQSFPKEGYTAAYTRLYHDEYRVADVLETPEQIYVMLRFGDYSNVNHPITLAGGQGGAGGGQGYGHATYRIEPEEPKP